MINAQNVWTAKANYPGAGRHAAVGFVVGTKAYVGTGTDDVIFFNNFWDIRVPIHGPQKQVYLLQHDEKQLPFR